MEDLIAPQRLSRYHRRTKLKRSGRLMLLILFLILAYCVYKSIFSATPVKKMQALIAPTATPGLSPLGQVVQDALKNTQGTYGIVIKNFKTNEIYTLHENTVFQSASLYKLWVMGLTYQDIQQGKIHEDDTLSEDVAVLNNKFDIAPEDAELTNGTMTLPVNEALNQMITISHNYAAMLLTEKVSLNSLVHYIKQIGLTHSHIGFHGVEPTTTAGDIAQFLDKLYNGQLANQQYTGEMITLLKNQQLNNKLPRELPADVVIAHKTGELDDYTHDAGIIYTPAGNYLIVVLAKSADPSSAEDSIAGLSKSVYNYFTQSIASPSAS